MIKYICSDKLKLKKNEVREKAGICFQKGLSVGYAAAMRKIEKIRRVARLPQPLPRITLKNNPVRLRPIPARPVVVVPSIKDLLGNSKQKSNILFTLFKKEYPQLIGRNPGQHNRDYYRNKQSFMKEKLIQTGKYRA